MDGRASHLKDSLRLPPSATRESVRYLEAKLQGQGQPEFVCQLCSIVFGSAQALGGHRSNSVGHAELLARLSGREREQYLLDEASSAGSKSLLKKRHPPYKSVGRSHDAVMKGGTDALDALSGRPQAMRDSRFSGPLSNPNGQSSASASDPKDHRMNRALVVAHRARQLRSQKSSSVKRLHGVKPPEMNHAQKTILLKYYEQDVRRSHEEYADIAAHIDGLEGGKFVNAKIVEVRAFPRPFPSILPETCFHSQLKP
jgi:hypothetical protein